MAFSVSTVFRTPVSEHTHQFQAARKKRITRSLSMSAATSTFFLPYSLANPIFGVGINDRLLINMFYSFDMSHIVSALGDKGTG